MIIQNETAFAEQNPSRWQKILGRLAIFEQSMRNDARIVQEIHAPSKRTTLSGNSNSGPLRR